MRYIILRLSLLGVRRIRAGRKPSTKLSLVQEAVTREPSEREWQGSGWREAGNGEGRARGNGVGKDTARNTEGERKRGGNG